LLDAGPARGRAHDAHDVAPVEVTAMALLAALEDRLVRAGVRDELLEIRPGVGAQQHRPGLLALPEERHLARLPSAPIPPRLEVAYLERAQLAYPPARRVEEADEHAVPEVRLQRDHAVDLGFSEDPLRE